MRLPWFVRRGEFDDVLDGGYLLFEKLGFHLKIFLADGWQKRSLLGEDGVGGRLVAGHFPVVEAL